MAAGPKIPISCTTIELKDLSDVIDFEKESEVGTIYGFEFTNDGYYKRKEIDDNDEKPRFPKFEQIRDVITDNVEDDTKYNLVRKDKKWILQETSFDDIVDTSDFKENILYNVVHRNGKWTLTTKRKIDWLIKFEFKSPNTLIGKNNTLKKALNSGPLLTSLIPNKFSDVVVKQFKRNQYLIHRHENASGVTSLKFQPEVVIGNQCTIIFELIVKPLNVATKRSALINTLSDGIAIDWTELKDEELKVIIAIDKNGNTIRKISSDDKVDVVVSNFTSLVKFNLMNVELIGLYYIDRVLPDGVLQNIVGNDL